MKIITLRIDEDEKARLDLLAEARQRDSRGLYAKAPRSI